MSDIHKRDYGRELEKKKSRRTQKHRASQHRLTAKFKKELAGKKRQEQTAESRAAEQAEQSAELLTQEGATRLASGATTLLLHGKKNQIGNEQGFSDNNPSIESSDHGTGRNGAVERKKARRRMAAAGKGGDEQKNTGRVQRQRTCFYGKWTKGRISCEVKIRSRISQARIIAKQPTSSSVRAWPPSCHAAQTAGARNNIDSTNRCKNS